MTVYTCYVTYMLCMCYTGSSPEGLYVVTLYIICLNHFIQEAVTVYTHIIYTLHICISPGVARKTSILLYHVIQVCDRFMSGVVTVL